MATAVHARESQVEVLYDEWGRPNGGPGIKDLVKYLGSLARRCTVFPLHIRDWNEQSTRNKEDTWLEIQVLFIFLVFQTINFAYNIYQH